MCGIAGKLAFGHGETVAPALLERMGATLTHRGPDAGGIYQKGPVGLAHRRLAILDLESGRQPMANEDGTVWVVFNGEIYNYLELRADLIGRGHRFRTASDTEVLVHLYEERGLDFVGALRGMFALALWDERQRRLLLVRDRVGKKPLFYTVLPGRGLLFGSEIKAILQDPEVARELDAEALDAYLSLLYVPAPLTMFRGIRKLPAGHLLVATPDKVTVAEYWDLSFHPGAPRSERDCRDQLEAILGEAVRIRLRSDVPLGAFLSGGVDSSCVVAHMAAELDRPPVACSVGFDERGYDELPYARAVAAHLRCRHHEHVIEPDVQELVPRIVRFFDEPFADSSAVPTYYVSQVARRHVTVALSGDGGDEVFAGYSRHYLERLEHRLRRGLGRTGTRLLAAAAAGLPPVPGRRLLERLGVAPDAACAAKHCGFVFGGPLKARLYSDGLRASCRGYDPAAPFRAYYNRCSAADPLDKALYVDLKTYLADDILVKVDRMSMAHALEVRAPLLDHKLLEFTATLPAGLKLNGRTTKYLLKRVLAGRVPDGVLTRRKHGFTMPVAEWLRGSLRGLAAECFFSPRSAQRGLFARGVVAELWGDHQAGRRDYSHHLWALLMLELWQREYLDGAG